MMALLYRVFLATVYLLLYRIDICFSIGGLAPPNEFGTCDVRNSCSDSPDLTSVKMNCACTKTCVILDDCCPDISGNFPDLLTEEQIDDVMETITCMPISPIASRKPIYVTMQCLASYGNDYVRERCESYMESLPMSAMNLQEDPFMYTPVTATDTGLLYINVYCALCNGVTEYTFWSIEYVQTSSTADVSIFDNRTDLEEFLAVFPIVRIDITHPTETYHVCKPEVVRDCPDDWSEAAIREGCYGSALYVYQGPTVYWNMDCAICNGLTSDDVICIDSKWQLGSGDDRAPASFSLLLDFNSGDSEFSISGRVGRDVSTVTQECADGSVWDPFNQDCVYLFCPPGSTLQGELCIADGEDSSNQSFPLCTWFALKPGDFVIQDNNDLHVEELDLTLSEGDYFANSSIAYICTPYDKLNASAFAIKFDAAQGYLTLVGNILSIICLVLQIVVYSCFAVLRNTPGIALMCLACSLILGQLLFSIGMQGLANYGLCYAFALGMHYGFLAYFFWMNVVAFDIWHTFNSNLRSASRSGSGIRKRLIAYSVYAWGVPALIVALSIILDQTPGTLVSPHYAAYICFLTSRMGLFLLFAVPLLLVLLVDIVFFGWTVFNIHHVAKSSAVARQNCADTGQLFLYVKLASVMGLTWIMGFIAAATNLTALWYIFIILNSFQGVWIFISFVCTKKVLRLVKDSVAKDKGRHLLSSDKRSSASTRNTLLTAQSSVGANLSTSRESNV